MKDILDNKKYQSILQDNEDSILLWAKRINYYQKTLLSGLTDTEQNNLILEIAGYLHEFFKLFTAFGKFKDTFINPTYIFGVEGIEAQITSEKMGHIYDFGFDYKGLYLEVSIRHPEYLKNVPDEFWQSLLSLSRFGQFAVEENGSFDKDVKRKFPHLFKPNKSNVYKLQRNYFFWETLYADNHPQRVFYDLGQFTMRWPPDVYSIDEVVIGGCEAFKIIYQLNYMLWKASKGS